MREYREKKINNIQSSKLIKLLCVLSSLEMKRFKKFLESPFHNSNEQITKLFLSLKKYHPTYQSPILNKEELYGKIFKKEPYRQQRMNDLMYGLRLLIEDFLIVSNTLEEGIARQQALVNILGQRNHDTFQEEAEKLIIEIQTKPTYLTGKDYLQLHQTYNQLWAHVDTIKIPDEGGVFKAATDNLDLFYLLTKLRYYAEQKDLEKVTANVEEVGFQFLLEAFKNQIPLKTKLPLFHIFNQIIQLLSTKSEEATFFQLKDYIVAHAELIEIDILRDLLVHLQNYCVKKISQGKTDFTQISFQLYQFIIDKGLVLVDGRIRESEFYNIAIIAYMLSKNEWGDNFVEVYQQCLNPAISSDIINLVLSYKYFYRQEYALSDEALQKVSYKNRIFYYVKVKIQIIRGLYEDWINHHHNNAEAILNHCIAYEQKIKRSKQLSEEKTKGYLNFIKYFKVLVHVKRQATNDIEKLHTLLKEIKQNPLVTYKTWLLEIVALAKKME